MTIGQFALWYMVFMFPLMVIGGGAIVVFNAFINNDTKEMRLQGAVLGGFLCLVCLLCSYYLIPPALHVLL
jgi:hypothetical protein